MAGEMDPQGAQHSPTFSDKSPESSPVKRRSLPISKLKIFLAALAFAFFARGLSGSYMKSSITQIERRFELSSSVVGLTEGSFEIGNLLVMVLVSYLGAKVHRPKVIAVGCLVMSFGSFVSVLSHFIMGRYDYKSIAVSMANSSASVSACSSASPPHLESSGNATSLGCKRTSSSYLWLFVVAGNFLRGIGEAPLMPLGLSYIDDFATEENSAFYIGTVRTFGLFGPTFGYMLGSFCANLWVDIAVVDVETLTINSKDMRWVGAWWLGVLICGVINFIASLPFWFLPYSLPKQGKGKSINKSSEVYTITKDSPSKVEPPKPPPPPPPPPQLKVLEAAKEFFPVLKKLLGNSIFLVYLFFSTLQFSALAGSQMFEPKFMEQQFNVSISRATFLIGIIFLPIAIVGMFLGGYLIKKFKLNTVAMAKFGCIVFLASFLLNLLYFMTNCEVLQVAGLTVNYSGIKEPSYFQENAVSACNAHCSCEETYWDPVCGSDGITYMSACLAGCTASVGHGKDMVFHNCSCVGVSVPRNFSAVLGQCPRDDCTQTYPYFLALIAIMAFILCLGATPLYMLMFRSVSPDLKSFAVGIETLCGRIFGGFPAPIYFGALIDKTCLKWGVKSCGGSGACRVFDTQAFRNVYLGLSCSLKFGCCLLYILLCVLIVRRFRQDSQEAKDNKNMEEPAIPSLKKEESSHVETSENGGTRF
ncbi:solute carrier organic anion transporter family member 1C1-like [Elgaria multicarinata webbii]|uniref:solute carrier organic anion transporter family member 1C1-like n=1 Tax=Elgaria multicarinata webbii TaxID=159646 RepID=UPI002FCCF7E3